VRYSKLPKNLSKDGYPQNWIGIVDNQQIEKGFRQILWGFWPEPWKFACIHEAFLRHWSVSRAIHDSSSVPITDNFIGESMPWRGPAWSACTAQVSKFRGQSSEISHPVIPDRFEGEAPECVSLWLYPRRRPVWLTGISHSWWQNPPMARGPCYSRTALRGTPAVQNQNSHGTTKESLPDWGGTP